jgi:L-amino acid N-acyltransferase YncA
MTIRHARRSDLPGIVAIYNASIPGRMATADLTPVTVADREAWFSEFDPARRPLFVACADGADEALGWLSLRSFYGRPAYAGTVEVGIYTSPAARRQGYGRALLGHALRAAPSLGITRLLAFTFAHNEPSLALFRGFGFETWGRLPGVAKLDGVSRDLLILGRGA